jgi:CubicO group peptidase (beta-lactamase class C family)
MNIMDINIKKVINERFKLLHGKMKEYVEQNKLPGIITLIYQDGKIIDCDKYGMADVENKIPIEFDNIFRIASMTKPIVTVAALMLYEEGKFSLEDPLSKFMPKVNDLKVFKGEEEEKILTEELNREITILDLMTHSAGFSYLSDPNHPLDKKYSIKMNAFKANGDKSLAEVMDVFFDVPLKFQPGTTFHYSFSTDILGYLIEIISGMPLDKFLQDRIFAKLEMKDTGFFVPEAKLDRLVHIYILNKEGQLIKAPEEQQRYGRDKTIFFSGGGGLVSTLSDYLRFAVMLLNNGKLEEIRLLKEETVQLMIQDHVISRDIPFINEESVKRLGVPDHMAKIILEFTAGSGFGLGVQVKLEDGNIPAGIHGWGGAFLTDYWVDPKNNLVFVFMTQFPNVGYPIRNDLRNLTYKGLRS